jgi:putative membrane protein
MDSKIAGSIAGAVATVPMTAVMKAFENWDDLPPRIITEKAVAGTLDNEETEALSVTAHFGFGATAGAGYAAFAGQSGLPPAAEGALYGLAVWGGAYLGLLPETGLFPRATDDRKSRTLVMVGAHVVWGAALGIVCDMLSRKFAEKS